MLILGYDSDKHAFEVANSSPICVFLILLLINTSCDFCLLNNEQRWEPPRENKKLIVRKLREIRTHASLHKTCFSSSFRATQLLPLWQAFSWPSFRYVVSAFELWMHSSHFRLACGWTELMNFRAYHIRHPTGSRAGVATNIRHRSLS